MSHAVANVLRSTKLFQCEIIINIFVSSLCFTGIPMRYGYTAIINILLFQCGDRL